LLVFYIYRSDKIKIERVSLLVEKAGKEAICGVNGESIRMPQMQYTSALTMRRTGMRR